MKKQLPQLADKIRYNGLYKFVALIVAGAIWLTTLHGRKDSVLMRNMSMEFVTRPGYVVLPQEDLEYRVRVTGPRAQLKKFSQSGRVLTVQLRNVNSGVLAVELSRADVQLPVGVKLLSIAPEKVNVEVRESK